jgi:hypothetical protein
MSVQATEKTITTPHFCDVDGRRWSVRITVRTVRSLIERLGIDIRELCNDEAKPLVALISDVIELPRVLYVVCADQAKEAVVSEEEFLDKIYGDVLEYAGAAFSEAFIDFFPNPQLRNSIATMLRLVKELRNEIANDAENRVNQAIESVDVISIARSIVSPESSESTQASSASEN